jgi:hypothetical protein
VLLSRRLQSHCRTPVALKKKMGMASILAISAGGTELSPIESAVSVPPWRQQSSRAANGFRSNGWMRLYGLVVLNALTDGRLTGLRSWACRAL